MRSPGSRRTRAGTRSRDLNRFLWSPLGKSLENRDREGAAKDTHSPLRLAAVVPKEYTFGVKAICILMLAMAGGAMAQEPAAPPGQFYAPLMPKTDAAKFFQGLPGVVPLKALAPLRVIVPPQPATSRCAVPLVQMQAPRAGDSGMQFVPRMDTPAPMPQANLPPACEGSFAR
jgi:hypothetical protein